MRKTRCWKHTTRNPKQYGKRSEERYQSDFMILDERYLKEEGENERG